MDPRMNGYDGCQSSYQDGGFGYDLQQQQCVNNQQAYTNNQGSYHHQQWNNQGTNPHQQWNNNYQDPYSSYSPHQKPSSPSSRNQDTSQLAEAHEMLKDALSKCMLLIAMNEKLDEKVKELEEQREEDQRVFSSQNQAPSSSSSQHQDTPHLAEAFDALRNTTIERDLLLAMNEKLDERVKELEEQREEDQRVLDALGEKLKSQEIDKEEASDKGDSNEQAPKVLIMETCDLPKVKKSLQALLENDDLGEFLSKVEHLKFILDNKEMLGEVLNEYEEEQGSNIYMRTTFEEASSMKKKEIIRIEDMIQVEQVVKTTDEIMHDSPLVLEQRETLQPMQHAKRKRRKKPKPPPLTFKPLRFIDGKLECKVSSKGRSKPFSRVKILFAPSLKGEDWGTVNEAMAKIFGMKLGDRGPLYQSKFPIPPNG